MKIEEEIIYIYIYFDAEISGANDMLDLAGDKHRFELGRKISCPLRNVKIPQCQYQHHPQLITNAACF